jgi:hypothetical protein
MPQVIDLKFIDAAYKAAELQRAAEAKQWEFQRLAMQVQSSFVPGMPQIELFPIAHPSR